MRLLMLAAAGLAVSGCATVTRGLDESWTVTTVPAGAGVRTSDQRFCDATPCTFRLSHRADFDVTITMAGYKTWKGHVRHHVAPAGGAGFVGNALIGGVYGATLDITTGAALSLDPNPLNVTLEAVEVVEAPAAAPSAQPEAQSPPPAPAETPADEPAER